ncbi:hypothetical protein CBOM_05590 [Ceraceosorus bombacis]|uniref:Uncharacterized protein n=1 Tax=Ceraceosorus bombacis TaxID=401625 RepID=A0A0P1BRJ3_9BASI|nr:hypothetical protein CBOM_05590 [Ceraceosorus bombacis]
MREQPRIDPTLSGTTFREASLTRMQSSEQGPLAPHAAKGRQVAKRVQVEST